MRIEHGWAFKGQHFRESGDHLVLTPGNFSARDGLRLRPEKDRYYGAEFPARYLLAKGDLIVAMTDLTQNAPILGAPAFVPEHQRYLHNQRLGLILVDESRADRRFVYYLFQLEEVRGQIRATATGTTVRHTAPNRIAACQVALPSLEDQRRIAGLLGAYDDLIAANRRRMALLEESAHLLYCEWFERLRFPAHEWTPIIGGVPAEWQRGVAGDAVAFNPRTSVKPGEEAPFVPMGSLSTTGMGIEPIEQRVPSGGARFRNGDTLLARITPCLENGKTGFVQFLPDDDAVATGSTEFIVMRGSRVPSTWVYCLARSESFRQFAINHLTGSDGRQRVSADEVATFPVVIPSASVLAEWESFARPRFEAVQVLARQNAKLREARDYLLPRLMSGQLTV